MFSHDNNIYIPTFITLTLGVYYIHSNSVVKQSSASKAGKHSVNLSVQSSTEIDYPIFFFFLLSV